VVLGVSIKDEDQVVWWLAADALGQIGDPRAVEPLSDALLVYSSNPSSGKGGGRRGTGEDWIMVVVVEPYNRKLSRSRSS